MEKLKEDGVMPKALQDTHVTRATRNIPAKPQRPMLVKTSNIQILQENIMVFFVAITRHKKRPIYVMAIRMGII